MVSSQQAGRLMAASAARAKAQQDWGETFVTSLERSELFMINLKLISPTFGII